VPGQLSPASIHDATLAAVRETLVDAVGAADRSARGVRRLLADAKLANPKKLSR
jgi:hypothetical protein